MRLLVLVATGHVVVTGQNLTSYPLSSECWEYLQHKGFKTITEFKHHMQNYHEGSHAYHMPCAEHGESQMRYAPNPRPHIQGSTDTSHLSCRYGNVGMFGSHERTCCGLKPHFNWVVGTCQETGATGQFCRGVPKCAKDNGVKINYVAAYQYDGHQFVLMDESSVGEISGEGIKGSYNQGTGWRRHMAQHKWKGGDWTTKYAPWAKGDGHSGPRGATPPAALWILSAENFYYGAFYMLPQLTLNLEGKGQPTGTNCWLWELDPVEGAAGWNPSGGTPGNLNQLYSTSNAQSSGCMPLGYTAAQTNGNKHSFTQPHLFKDFCTSHPDEPGCSPWKPGHNVAWSGGAGSTHRFENLWDEAYVFAVVIDADGYWTYRWRPDASTGQTGWQGVHRHSAARTLPARPRPVRDEAGLRTDVPGHVHEAVILQPSLQPAAACLRASIEGMSWQWGSDALGSMATEIHANGLGGSLEGAQNWWAHFHSTHQYAGYPVSISGVPRSHLRHSTCSARSSWSCHCHQSGGWDTMNSNSSGTSDFSEDILV